MSKTVVSITPCWHTSATPNADWWYHIGEDVSSGKYWNTWKEAYDHAYALLGEAVEYKIETLTETLDWATKMGKRLHYSDNIYVDGYSHNPAKAFLRAGRDWEPIDSVAE